jgi:hypothetical protein
MVFFVSKAKLGYIFEEIGIENVGIFYDHFEYCMDIWYILGQFDIF